MGFESSKETKNSHDGSCLVRMDYRASLWRWVEFGEMRRKVWDYGESEERG